MEGVDFKNDWKKSYDHGDWCFLDHDLKRDKDFGLMGVQEQLTFSVIFNGGYEGDFGKNIMHLLWSDHL